MAFGKDAARNIDGHLMGESRYDSVLPGFSYDQTPPQPSASPRHNARFLPAATRARSFEEAVSPLRADEARDESCRCLRCDIRETAHAVSRR